MSYFGAARTCCFVDLEGSITGLDPCLPEGGAFLVLVETSGWKSETAAEIISLHQPHTLTEPELRRGCAWPNTAGHVVCLQVLSFSVHVGQLFSAKFPCAVFTL